jgi:hypothetical protein
MSLPKVYLAKSNRANPDVVSRVRQALSKFPIQIVEYTGGQFSHAPMMECEQLVVVPDLDEEEVVIGKGLYEQINKFGDCKGFEYVFVLTDEDLSVKDVDDMDVLDYDDYVSYAVIEFSRGKGDKLVRCFEDIYGVKATDSLYPSPKTNSNYYQLIGRKK